MVGSAGNMVSTAIACVAIRPAAMATNSRNPMAFDAAPENSDDCIAKSFRGGGPEAGHPTRKAVWTSAIARRLAADHYRVWWDVAGCCRRSMAERNAQRPKFLGRLGHQCLA